jgi:hypothetical protein
MVIMTHVSKLRKIAYFALTALWFFSFAAPTLDYGDKKADLQFPPLSCDFPQPSVKPSHEKSVLRSTRLHQEILKSGLDESATTSLEGAADGHITHLCDWINDLVVKTERGYELRGCKGQTVILGLDRTPNDIYNNLQSALRGQHFSNVYNKLLNSRTANTEEFMPLLTKQGMPTVIFLVPQDALSPANVNSYTSEEYRWFLARKDKMPENSTLVYGAYKLLPKSASEKCEQSVGPPTRAVKNKFKVSGQEREFVFSQRQKQLVSECMLDKMKQVCSIRDAEIGL